MLDKIVEILPYFLLFLSVYMLFDLIRDFTKLGNIGEIYIKKFEWGQAAQTLMALVSMLILISSRLDYVDVEFYYYVLFILVSVVRVLIGIRIGEEGVVISNKVYLYDDIAYYEINPYRKEEVFISVASHLRPSKMRSVTVKIKGKERETFMTLMKQYGIEMKLKEDKAS